MQPFIDMVHYHFPEYIESILVYTYVSFNKTVQIEVMSFYIVYCISGVCGPHLS